jgi:hypothetical protein
VTKIDVRRRRAREHGVRCFSLNINDIILFNNELTDTVFKGNRVKCNVIYLFEYVAAPRELNYMYSTEVHIFKF